jgi:RNA polymerase sigma-70 factor (ECF subfamily)
MTFIDIVHSGALMAIDFREASSSIVAIWETERSHLRRLAHRWIARVYDGKGDASDLVQETYLDALRSKSVPPRGASYRSWLARILWRNCLNFVQAFRRDVRDIRKERPLDSCQPDKVQQAALVTVLDSMINTERAEKLRLAISRLDSADQEVLWLRAEERLGFREIGERMGKSEDAARMQWCRALLNAKRILEDER